MAKETTKCCKARAIGNADRTGNKAGKGRHWKPPAGWDRAFPSGKAELKDEPKKKRNQNVALRHPTRKRTIPTSCWVTVEKPSSAPRNEKGPKRAQYQRYGASGG